MEPATPIHLPKDHRSFPDRSDPGTQRGGHNGLPVRWPAGSEVWAGVLRRVTTVAAATVAGLHHGVHALAIERPPGLIAMAGLKASLTVRPNSHVLNGRSHLDCRAASRCVVPLPDRGP